MYATNMHAVGCHVYMYMCVGVTVLLVCLSASTNAGQGVHAKVFNALSTSKPAFESITHPLQPNSFWGTNIVKPYPTNTWWQNLVLNTGLQPAHPNPYVVRSTDQGVEIGLPPKTITADYVATFYQPTITFGTEAQARATGAGPYHKVIGFDEMSVTLQLQSPSVSAGKLSLPLVRGSPYITGIYESLYPTLSTVNAILSVNGQTQPGQVTTDHKLKLVLNNGQTVLVYTSIPAVFQWTVNGIKAISQTITQAPNRWVIRVAVLPSNPSSDAETVLDVYANTYPTGVNLDYSLASNGLSSTTVIRWRTASLSTSATSLFAATTAEAALLMCTLPHHMDIIDQSAVFVTSLAYDIHVGSMASVVGATWTLVDNFGTNGNIDWQASQPIPANRVADIRKQLLVDKNIVDWKTIPDPYFGGKGLGKMARLALIADELGETTAASEIRANMKQVIQPWLSGTNQDKWQYDTTWGGIVTSSGVKDQGADFGAGYYNDHHYHSGYFIYAAAVIVKGDSAWGAQYKEAILALVRDIANPSPQDTYFPVHRYFDLYSSHSWASGLFEFADARNQESSSEAINAWYGTYLLGLAFNDNNVRDLGSYLMHSEIRATKKYWHMTTASSVYPAAFAANKCVGMVWGDKVVFATWFASGAIYVHGIQMLPFTPITELYLTRDWVNEEYPVVWNTVKNSLSSTPEGWLGFLYMDHAVIDSATAWNEVLTLKTFDDGNTLTNALYWIATRPTS